MQIFNGSDKVGDVVARFPKAGDVFKRHGIDFCCGGNRSIHDTIQGLDVREEQILDELNKLYKESLEHGEQDIDWTAQPIRALVDHIVNVHHAYLNTTLPQLGELTTKILRVHGSNHQELAELHRLFHSLKVELKQHLIKEETLVFPRIMEYEASKSHASLEAALNAIEELEKEHDRCGDILKEMRSVTQGYAVPADACRTYQYTFAKLEELESNTFTHVHLENNILYSFSETSCCPP